MYPRCPCRLSFLGHDYHFRYSKKPKISNAVKASVTNRTQAITINPVRSLIVSLVNFFSITFLKTVNRLIRDFIGCRNIVFMSKPPANGGIFFINNQSLILWQEIVGFCKNNVA